MSRSYYDRYNEFVLNGSFKIVPGINLPIKPTDQYVIFKKNKDRLDKLSDQYYQSPLFGWLIMSANKSYEIFNIPDNSLIRIPFPLITSLQDYKSSVDLYKQYYGG